MNAVDQLITENMAKTLVQANINLSDENAILRTLVKSFAFADIIVFSDDAVERAKRQRT